MFRIIINGDKEITENFGLRKDSENAPIEQVGVSKSVEFQDLVEKKWSSKYMKSIFDSNMKYIFFESFVCLQKNFLKGSFFENFYELLK